MTTTDTELAAELAQTATRIIDIDAQLEALKAERERLVGWIRATLPPDTTTSAGDHTIKVQNPTRRLNKTRIAREFPVDQWPGLYTLQLDTEAVKRGVSPLELDARDLYTTSASTVKIS